MVLRADKRSGVGPGDTTVSADSVVERDGRERIAGELVAGRWEILGRLGQGGMGTVYRARDRELEEVVALKVLNASVREDALERFRREVKLSRRVTHRNVARVHEIGEHAGQRFFTMELVDGESLRELLARKGAMPIGLVVEIAQAIARGLAAAHEVGVVHRDLKPDNVLMGKDGRIAITDFGIAASVDLEGGAARTSSFVGTPLYMAPEQVDRSRPIDARTDLYAFGAVLYEMLTGRAPFEGETSLAIAVARLTQPAPDPRRHRSDIPAGLTDLVAACMARDPDARPSSAGDVEQRLETTRAQLTASMTPPAAPPSIARETPVDVLTALSQRGATKVAVLAIANSRPEDAYLADGLTEDLTDNLSTIRKLHVLSRSAAGRFRAKADADPREVGEVLGVDVVAEGSLRRAAPGKLRLSLRLVCTRQGLQLWSKRFDVDDSEILDVSEQAAHAIAEALTVEGPRFDRKLSAPEAVDLYLRARAEYRQFSPEGAQRAIALFERALALEPDDPLLVSGHAIALSRLSFFAGEHHAAAEEAARRAVELAPQSGEANLAFAAAAMQGGRHVDALRAGLAAVALSPSSGEAHLMVGRILAEVGPLDVALRFLDTSFELEPGQSVTHLERSRVLALLGRWDDAVKAFVPLPGDDKRMGQQIGKLRIGMWRRDKELVERGARELEAMAAASEKSSDSSALVARTFASMARPETDLASLEIILGGPSRSVRRETFAMQMMAEVAGYHGSSERGIAMLARAVHAGLRDLMWLEHCPTLAVFRSHPDYPELHRVVVERAEEVRAVMRRSGQTTRAS